jgi:electron transport complex protein RnfG
MTHAVIVPSYRKRLGYQSGLLGGIGLLTSVILVIADVETHDAINLAKAADKKASFEQVLPSSLYDNDLLKDTLVIPNTASEAKGESTTVYLARDENRQIVAVAFEQVGYGYAGAINVVMGISRQGEILGVRVLSHAETPGLGDKIEAKRNDWILKFNGLSLNNPEESKWKVKKDGGYFDQFSGATITPRAVVKTVKQGLTFFAQHREQILTQETNSPIDDYASPTTITQNSL